jgi:hypothetical protein
MEIWLILILLKFALQLALTVCFIISVFNIIFHFLLAVGKMVLNGLDLTFWDLGGQVLKKTTELDHVIKLLFRQACGAFGRSITQMLTLSSS